MIEWAQLQYFKCLTATERKLSDGNILSDEYNELSIKSNKHFFDI
jgi:hypothetical protein